MEIERDKALGYIQADSACLFDQGVYHRKESTAVSVSCRSQEPFIHQFLLWSAKLPNVPEPWQSSQLPEWDPDHR